MPVTGLGHALSTACSVEHTDALAGVSGPVVSKVCEQGWLIHGNVSSLLGILSGPWDVQLLTRFLHNSAANQTFITGPQTAFQYAGHPAHLHLMPRVTSGYPVTGRGSLAKFDTHLHLSPCFQHPTVQQVRETDKKPSDLCSTLLFLPQFLADGRKWTGEAGTRK